VTRSATRALSAASLAGVALATLAAASPALADSAPAPDCRAVCTAVFDTSGPHSIAVPAGVTSLQATVAGAAGLPAAGALPILPDAVGGPGGVTTAVLPTTLGGTTLTVSVGAAGEGSAIAAADGALLVVSGGGGGGGYAGRLTLPDQIFAAYPGGTGGAASAPGVAPGGDAAAFGVQPFNGFGGGATGGAGGSGDAAGGAGSDAVAQAPGSIALAAGGAGGALAVQDLSLEAGAGGGGYTGGGGGAVDLGAVDGGDEIMLDVVAPGGGGAGFLADGLTAVAEAPNTGGGSVQLTWSLPPLPSPSPAPSSSGPALAETGAPGYEALGAAVLLLAAGATAVALERRRRTSTD
jgi:hypothetical protein